MSIHIANHSFIIKPHSHSFYLFVYINRGTGKHFIDFEEYAIQAGNFFALRPGQVHNWQLSEDIEGYVIFLTEEVYNLYFKQKNIKHCPLFSSPYNNPCIAIPPSEAAHIEYLLQAVLTEYSGQNMGKNDKILNLIDCLLIDTTRNFSNAHNHAPHLYNTYTDLLEHLIEDNFLATKSPVFYANKMNVTTKHLNRICRTVLNKTTTELITQRVILESKRLLANEHLSVSQIAIELGYEDISYFSKLFKKHTGFSALEFRKNLT